MIFKELTLIKHEIKKEKNELSIIKQELINDKKEKELSINKKEYQNDNQETEVTPKK